MPLALSIYLADFCMYEAVSIYHIKSHLTSSRAAVNIRLWKQVACVTWCNYES